VSVIAEFTFRHPGLPLMETMTATGVELDVEQAVAADPDRPVLFVWASGGDFEDFETLAPDDDTVASIDRIEDAGDRRLYRVQVADTDGPVLYPLDDRLEASRLSVSSSADGLEVRLRFPDRESLAAYRPLVADRGVEVILRRVYDAAEGAPAAEFSLTEKQRTALLTAVESGYYDVPRKAELADVANDLDVSTQSVSERLRRGVATFVRNALD
jgi:predicted DNA binding protein